MNFTLKLICRHLLFKSKWTAFNRLDKMFFIWFRKIPFISTGYFYISDKIANLLVLNNYILYEIFVSGNRWAHCFREGQTYNPNLMRSLVDIGSLFALFNKRMYPNKTDYVSKELEIIFIHVITIDLRNIFIDILLY